MKKNIILSLLSVSAVVVFFITGCSKDDTTPPSISITGGTSEEVSLGGSWTDPGATATDEEDGAVTVTSDASTTNPNTHHVGTYTITYTATDAAGNVGTAIKTVRVKNDAENFAKTYNVTDIVDGVPIPPYTQIITVDDTINNRVHFNRFGDYNNNTDIYAVKDPGTGRLSIPFQSSNHDIGTNNSGTCDVVKHYFYSTGFSTLSSSILFDYVDSLAGSVPCNGSSSTGQAEYSF